MSRSSERIRHSAIYRGWVRHRRKGPRAHAFRYRLFLTYLDLDELERAFERRWLWSARRPAPAWFRRADYLGPTDVPLDEAVRARVQDRLGFRPTGAVRVLTQLRMWGYAFNPVSFYYCFEADGSGDERMVAVVAEITNTPWGERHAYVLDARRSERRGRQHAWRFAKDFHVSPFFDMDLDYDWRFREPGERVAVHMVNRRQDTDESVFDATLVMQREPLDGPTLAKALCRHPWTTLKVSLGIYWQALRLWLKRTPFYTHPAKRVPAPVGDAE